jgi:hypothetical protein
LINPLLVGVAATIEKLKDREDVIMQAIKIQDS